MISAVVLTKNEEKNIADCLKTLTWCDEILVIDDSSTDTTQEIAKKHGATVVVHSIDNNFASQRNFGLEKARHQWVLFIDADERMSESLKNEILKRVGNERVNGYYLKRQDSMWGKVLRYGEQGDMQLLRLGRKGKGKWRGKVHETWEIEGNKNVLDSPLLHFSHPTLKEFLSEINFYSTLRAQELQSQGVKSGFVSVIGYPKAKFLQDYFLKLGLLDGIEGFIVAMMMSLHSFLVRGKLWQLNNK